jgi:hypothetical protein
MSYCLRVPVDYSLRQAGNSGYNAMFTFREVA